jgi:hypothetical protein
MKPTDKQKKPSPPTQRAQPKSAAKAADNGPIRFSAIIFNVVAGIVSMLFLSAFFQHHEPDPTNPAETHLNSGYDWLLNTMLKGNLETIDKNPDKTLMQKYELKWGPGEIEYVNLIKSIVPESGTVLMPPPQIFKQAGFVMTQTGPVVQRLGEPNVKAFSMSDLPWIEYFLYPRKCVYADSTGTSAKGAGYVVSIGGWGLDRLSYQVEKPEAFMVLPITK